MRYRSDHNITGGSLHIDRMIATHQNYIVYALVYLYRCGVHHSANVAQSTTRTGWVCARCPHTRIVFAARSNTTELSVMQQSLPEPDVLVLM